MHITCNSQCCQSKNEQPILIHCNTILRKGTGTKTLLINNSEVFAKRWGT